MSEIKDSQMLNLETTPTLSSPPLQSVIDSGTDSIMTRDYVRESAGELGGRDYGKGVGSLSPVVGERGRVVLDSKTWQQEGDWSCPNPSCSNINFSFRGICNRCGTARPAGSLLAIGGGLGCGRIRGRGHGDAGCKSGRGSGGPLGIFGPNDWNCPMCGNINWAKRTKCNICNTAKPGYNEGGAREGRAGGYKEFDEAEIEETKRRRRDIKEDDGEMYDEFGNLKKKFRAKSRAGDSVVASALATGGMAKAGCNKEDFGVAEQSQEKCKDLRFRYDNDTHLDRGGRAYVQHVPSVRSSQRGNERDTRCGVDEWCRKRDRGDSCIKDRDRVSGGAWAWERGAVTGRGGNECVSESESGQRGEWLRCKKRLKERDTTLD